MKTIRIKEDVQIPGTDIILEKGDIIHVKERTVRISKVFGGEHDLEVYDSVPKKWELWVPFRKEGLMGIGYAGDKNNPYNLTEVGVLSTRFTDEELKILGDACVRCGFRRPEQYDKLIDMRRNERYLDLLEEADTIMLTRIEWD